MTQVEGTLTVIDGKEMIVCDVCGAKCRPTSKEANRFAKRHPSKCSERREFSKQLAEGTRSVDADVLTAGPVARHDDWIGDDKLKPLGYDPKRDPKREPPPYQARKRSALPGFEDQTT